MSSKRSEVTECARGLVKLFESPEAGLATWHLMCERAYQDLLTAAAQADEPIRWSQEHQPVPGFEGWHYALGKGGPCWYVALDVDGYTHAMLTPDGDVSARNAPTGVVRWLLDNAPIEAEVSR